MKIAVDTNVLVRIIALDDEQKVKKAVTLIEKHGPREVFVCYGALSEAFYVLTKVYGLSKNEVLKSFGDLFKIEQFAFEHEIPLRLALCKCEKGASFHDALLGEIAAARNLKTHTFDKNLKNNTNFEVIP